MRANELKLSKINSKVDDSLKSTIEEIERKVSEHINENSFAVAYMDYTVLIGRYEEGKFLFFEDRKLEGKYLQKLRVFNATEEVLFWRTKDGFKGRYRQDSDGNNFYVVEAKQALFGTDVEELNEKFSRIFEDRGTQIILPFKNLDKKKRVFIKTRNYIAYNDVFQAGYEDCRFVSFTDGKNDL